MPENTNYLGLCSTCKYASSCKFPRDPDKPSFYCEEFELEEISPVKLSGKERAQMRESVVPEQLDTGGFIGLCSNCDNRNNCAFPMPEGGVWHCEEYS